MNSALGNIKAITKRELTGYFASPVAYVFIVIFLIVSITAIIQRTAGAR